MKKVKIPLGYVIIGSLLAIVLIALFATTEVQQEMAKQEELYGKNISMTSTGSDSIYVNSGVQVALDSVYFKDNYIALRIMLTNNSGAAVEVEASIPSIYKNASLSSKPGGTCIQYIIIGDDRASSYDMDVTITQKTKTLGYGTIHIVQDPSRATVLTEQNVIFFNEEMEIYLLGKHDNAAFFLFKNKTADVKEVSMATKTYSYKTIVPPDKNYYDFAMGLGNTSISVNTFDVNIETTDEIIIK